MRGTIEQIADEMDLCEGNLREFLDKSFSKIAKDAGLDGTQFQRRAKKTGDAFEYCFEIIMEKLHPDIELIPGEPLPEACMVRGGNADFVVYSGGITEGEPKRLIAVIEAKGSADKVEGANGEIVEFNRPGMLRTDTVKKAISNGYQVSQAFPDALYFIVTSHKPTSGNAKCMCDLAEGDLVDKIVDVTEKEEIDEMAEIINEKY